jgi:hypothetical protein
MYFVKWNNGPLKSGDRSVPHHAAQILGKIWNFPNTALGWVWGELGGLLGAAPDYGSSGHNALVYEDHPFQKAGALTLGNTIHVPNDIDEIFPGDTEPVWMHEIQHTYQGQQLGPLYLPSNILGQLSAFGAALFTKMNYYDANMSLNWNERGPYAKPSVPWR